MKTYYVYDTNTDEYIGYIKATSVVDAEIKASAMYNRGSDEIYALTEKA